jgi:hypothetical protein
MIELTTTALLILTSLYGNPTATTTDTKTNVVSATPIVMENKAGISIPNNENIEKRVRNFFKDDPILIEIARCESSFRQYDENGEILRGKVNKSDVGIMQINEYYHKERIERLGVDPETIEGNLAYAKWLYEKEGGQPWKASSSCWNKPNIAISNQLVLK